MNIPALVSPRSSTILAVSAALALVAMPACAQGLLATSSASSSAMTHGQRTQVSARAALSARALTQVAFTGASPASALRRSTTFGEHDAVTEAPVQAKPEWSSDEGFRMSGSHIAYKSRF